MPPFIHLAFAATVYHMRHPITGDLTVSHWTNKAGWNIISALQQCGHTFLLWLCECLGSTCCNTSPESNSPVPHCSNFISICLQSSRFNEGHATNLIFYSYTSFLFCASCYLLGASLWLTTYQDSWWPDHKYHKSKLLLILTICVICHVHSFGKYLRVIRTNCDLSLLPTSSFFSPL